MTSADQLYADAPRDIAAYVDALGLELTIGGADAPRAGTKRLIDPCTGEQGASYPDAAERHVDLAVEAASRAYGDWSGRSWSDRRSALEHFATLMEADLGRLATILSIETGRPLRRALIEVGLAARNMRITAAVEMPPVALDHQGLAVTLRRKSLGVAGAIAPWNAPVVLAMAKLANALMAGDTLVLRPSPLTPLSALHLGRLAREAFPPGVVNVITGEAEVGAAMVAHPGIAKISFTGSTETGKRIAIAAAPTLKKLTLELGGNDAAIVLPDADVEAVAATVFQICFANSGHFCAAIKRLYVHEAVLPALREALLRQIGGAVLGDRFDPAVTMGPVQNRPQFDKIWAMFDDAVAQGGRVVTGGVRHDGPGFFIPPTLIEGVGHGVALVDDEQFGPVLPMIPFSDVEEAIAMANRGIYGLGGSIWTADIDRGVALAQRLEAGTGWVNQHGAFTAAIPMPFARQSGIGMDYAEYGVGEHMRTMVVNARLPAA